ncbi:MAG: hypothetical protein RR425_06070, partial [Erysipelotrichales bacterium]
QFKRYDDIICIDLKSFFATAECIALGLDPFKTDLVVADASRGESSIVLATSPSLRAKGMPGRFRLFELPKNLKVHIVKPRMAYYVHMSNKILKMYLEYFSSEDILVYSIDEVFIDVGGYLSLYDKSIYEMAQFLLSELLSRFGMYATCGIGDNMLLAKFALDIEAKHNDDFIATWRYEDLPNKLWPITDLTDVWGIGRGMEKRLHDLGIESMYDLAHYDIYKLVKYLGIMGEELYLHANGIDISRVQDQEREHQRKGYNSNQTLFHNTPKNEVRQYLKDLIIGQCERLRAEHKVARVVSLYIGYGSVEDQPPFRMQHKLAAPSFDISVISEVLLGIYDNHVLDIPIRRLGISLTSITEFEGVQLNLFAQGQDVTNTDLDFAYDTINIKYGQDTVFKASALGDESNYFKRRRLIGGHNAGDTGDENESE